MALQHRRVTADFDHCDLDVDLGLDLAGASTTHAEYLQRIIAARAAVEKANAELRLAVKAAHEAGESWAAIAVTLDAFARSHGHAAQPPGPYRPSPLRG